MDSKMEQALQAIRDERAAQDAKWGADRDLPDGLWLSILMEEVGESAQNLNDDWTAARGSRNLLRAELVQAAAVIVAWLENLDRRYPASDIQDGAITEAKITAGAVTRDKIGNRIPCGRCGSSTTPRTDGLPPLCIRCNREMEERGDRTIKG